MLERRLQVEPVWVSLLVALDDAQRKVARRIPTSGSSRAYLKPLDRLFHLRHSPLCALASHHHTRRRVDGRLHPKHRSCPKVLQRLLRALLDAVRALPLQQRQRMMRLAVPSLHQLPQLFHSARDRQRRLFFHLEIHRRLSPAPRLALHGRFIYTIRRQAVPCVRMTSCGCGFPELRRGGGLSMLHKGFVRQLVDLRRVEPLL
mmetsp:Transcript_11095/g.41443  ORF Transcript_11095/g.41443 Transcript_11095/m.41443 type:complete len:203 (+) Transcript_11095:265-873(+)